MKYLIFAVRDRKAQIFARPFYEANMVYASRSFVAEVNRESDSMLFKHYRDFELLQLGEFDEASGRFTQLEVPVLVLTGDNAREEGLRAANGSVRVQAEQSLPGLS